MGDIMGDFVNFADITNQIYRREQHRNFEFNLMLVGLSGEGKSTLVTSLFRGKIKPHASTQGPKLLEYSELIEEFGTKLRLKCIETSNYVSHNGAAYKKYIETQLNKYFTDQRRHATWQINDSRVHCCLYLIPPYPKLSLRPEDIECMRDLHERVNLVPIIARSDTLESEQVAKFKENIKSDLESNGINYFKFDFDDKEDEERAKVVKEEAERFPFAVVAADGPTRVDDGSEIRWIRTKPYCKIDIFDKMYDFASLADLLIRHCMVGLRDDTHMKIYSKFKAQVMSEARRTSGVNLEEMGLNPREVKKILHEIQPLCACSN